LVLPVFCQRILSQTENKFAILLPFVLPSAADNVSWGKIKYDAYLLVAFREEK
jgi:hypothetical protein